MSKLDMFKNGVGWLVGAGVSKIVTDIIDDHVEPENIYQQVTVCAGKIGITMLVKEAVQGTVNKNIDAVVAKYHELRAEQKAES